ncbi:DDE-type integrase/transposase/recombinase [Candidatus Berkiella cookevillensis]|uniref:DDE-type integrase/transposase/recombinase n=2 Tax=Candidatus Berkiella cookevillensis TaxID=437022 RepID=A0AAE3HQS0_9GAMM|nr:DDE-type integrase/transposase/recombinase [Candidatus Berkiella cookevillensis]MCS5708807.1 DDE-type integrase/transposase/recombinase [Candidatus Berkiella cookevillensis]
MSSNCTEREELKAKVIDIHAKSRCSAGSRTISAQLKVEGVFVGRFLMKEAGIVSKQARKHKYKASGQSALIAANELKRELKVKQPNQVWCGDITFIWAGTRWLYLAVVLDLYARRVVGWSMST